MTPQDAQQAAGCSEPNAWAHRPVPAPAGLLRIEDADGDAIEVQPNHAPDYVANIVTDVWVEGVRQVAAVALDRDAARDLRDHLTARLSAEQAAAALDHDGWQPLFAAGPSLAAPAAEVTR